MKITKEELEIRELLDGTCFHVYKRHTGSTARAGISDKNGYGVHEIYISFNERTRVLSVNAHAPITTSRQRNYSVPLGEKQIQKHIKKAFKEMRETIYITKHIRENSKDLFL